MVRALWLLVALSVCACGRANAPVAESSASLLGGAVASPGEHPATGALLASIGDEAPHLLCAATLISPTVVVTAAHCFLGLRTTLPDFMLGDDAGATTADARVVVHSRAVHLHPEFAVRPAPGAPTHDLAIVQLTTAIDAPAFEGFARAGELDGGAPPSLLLVAYGPLARDAPAGRKNVARVNIIDVADSEWVVASPTGATACAGDSGGAAFSGDEGQPARLAALISRAENAEAPCEGGVRVTRLDAHAAWLTDQLAADATSPPRGSCSFATRGPPPASSSLLATATALLLLRRARRRPQRVAAHHRSSKPRR
ncbi:MAG: peptidase and chymotrypsin/Hap [Myxococcales bacterium]|nr:peptidase and chymotrypsin/Hap [Myxococcales bacterium]